MTPNEGRRLWRQTLESVTEENSFSPVLHHVLESVLVDLVEKRMELSDTFAVTIGNRIAFLIEAIAQAHADA